MSLGKRFARFAANLGRMRPDGGSVREFLFRGQESLDLEDALQVMGQLHKMEELERQLRRTQQGHNLDGVESELVRELMGEESHQELEQLRRMAEVLEDAGYIHQVGSHLELTPKGIRKIGHRALQGIFAYIRKDRLGSHRTGSTGAGGGLPGEYQEVPVRRPIPSSSPAHSDERYPAGLRDSGANGPRGFRDYTRLSRRPRRLPS